MKTLHGSALPTHSGVMTSNVQEAEKLQEIAPQSTSKPKVLVVEDVLINQKVISLMLERLGYKPDIVSTGKEALASYQNYHVIFMDIGLPDISGIDICKAIRSQTMGKEIYIIACTAHGDDVKEACFSAGMNDFTTKPIAPDTLNALLQKYLNLYS